MKRSRLAAVPLGLPIGLLGAIATGSPAQAAGEPEPVDATALAAPSAWRAIPEDALLPPDEDLLDIPLPALAAYQRAETVLAEALPTCHLEAALLAGIGRVETDHGHIGDWRLGTAAVMRPYLIGAPAPDATHLVPELADTDGGTWDRDSAADHPLGPLQIAPSLWQQAAVDGDGDGLRRPYDMDDAALALGVALCSRDADLASAAARAAALRTLNDRPAYVKAVEAYRVAYAAPVVAPAVYVDTVGVVVSAPPAAAPAEPKAASPKPKPKSEPAAKPAAPKLAAPKPAPAPPKTTPKPQPAPVTPPPAPAPVTTPPVTPPPAPTPVTPPPAPAPVTPPPAPTPPPAAPAPAPVDATAEARTATQEAADSGAATDLTSAVPGEALAATSA